MTALIMITACFAGSLAGVVGWRLWTQWEPTQRLLNEDRSNLAKTQDVSVLHDRSH